MIEDNCDKRKQKFYEMYQNEIAPIMFQFESERKQLKLLTILFTFISAFTLIGCFTGMFKSFFSELPVSLTYIVIIASIIQVIVVKSLCASFRKKIKQNCVPSITKIFKNLQWNLQYDTIFDYEIKASSLFSIYMERNSDDSFVGNYKGVDFKVSETYLYRKEGTGKNRHVVDVFKGIIINYKFNKPIKFKTIVVTKQNIIIPISLFILFTMFLYFIVNNVYFIDNNILSLYEKCMINALVFGPIILAIFLIINPNDTFELVKLEDPSFGKRFDVYSSDQVEARYLVTPSFMDRFYNLKTAFGSKGIKCSFYDDKLMIAIPTKRDLFEMGSIFTPLTDPKCIKKFYNELSSIYDLIDTFKLDEKTGL